MDAMLMFTTHAHVCTVHIRAGWMPLGVGNAVVGNNHAGLQRMSPGSTDGRGALERYVDGGANVCTQLRRSTSRHEHVRCPSGQRHKNFQNMYMYEVHVQGDDYVR
jgi:hypothetical protein